MRAGHRSAMNMLLTNCGPMVSGTDVAAFERRVGVTLPESYRRFLLEVNGGNGPGDESGYPPESYWSLHWLGGPVSDDDVITVAQDRSWWEDYDRRDLEFGVRGHWHDGLSRAWLPVVAAQHEDLVLIRLEDGSVWVLNLVLGTGFDDESAYTRIAGSFDELGLHRAEPGSALDKAG